MIKEAWATVSFEDLIGEGVLEIGDGYRAKNEELGGTGPIFLRAGHVTNTHIDFSGVERFHDRLAPLVAPKISRPGDTVITTKGNSTGRTAFVSGEMPEFVYSPHLSYWRSLDERRLAPGFLRYWCQGGEFRRQLLAMSRSTDMAPYLSLTDQRRLRITLPPWRRQWGIAHVLGALDEKIDLNRRTNAAMEAVTRALFKSWFIDFDPVRAKMAGPDTMGLDAAAAELFPSALTASEGHQIPTGWRLGRLDELIACPRRSIQPSAVQPDTPYFGLEHMPRRSIALGEWGAAADVTSGKLQFSRGEILFGKLRPYFQKVGLAPIDGVCSTDILVLVARSSANAVLVLCHVSSDELIRHVDAASTGTKMPRASWSDIARFQIAVPPVRVAAYFGQVVQPMLDRIVANIHESKGLAAMRDLLLPKLVSGELQIRDAVREVEKIA